MKLTIMLVLLFTCSCAKLKGDYFILKDKITNEIVANGCENYEFNSPSIGYLTVYKCSSLLGENLTVKTDEVNLYKMSMSVN